MDKCFMDRLPISSAQSGMWYSQQLDSNNPVFNTGVYTEIHGILNVKLLEEVIVETVQQTDSLKVHFEQDSLGIFQVLKENADVLISIVDVSNETDPHHAAMVWMKQDLQQPFDLLQGPLYKQVIFKLGWNHHYWYQRIHHIAIDAYSLYLITTCVADTYSARLADKPYQINMGSLHTLLEEENGYRSSSAYEIDRQYWLNKLEIDRDYAVFYTTSERNQYDDIQTVLRETRYLSGDLVRKLKQTAEANNITWYDLLIAAIASYLYRFTGNSRIVLGIPMMCRLGSVAVRIPSLMMNILPLQMNISPDDHILQVSRMVSHEMQEIKRHQKFRHEQLKRELNIVGTNKKMFGPVVNLIPFGTRLDFAGSTGQIHHLSAGPVEDICFHIHDCPDIDDVRIDIDANATLYDRRELMSHADRWIQVMEQLEKELNIPVIALDYLLPEEQRIISWEQQAKLSLLPNNSYHLSSLLDTRFGHNNERSMSGYYFELDETRFDRLTSLAKQYHSTVPMFMFAIYVVMLTKHEDQRDLAVGTRMGTLGKPVLITNRINRDTTFFQLLCQSTNQILRVTRYPDSDVFEKVTCDYAFAFTSGPELLQNTKTSAEGTGSTLLYTIEDRVTTLHISIYFSASRYRRDEIAIMAEHYIHLLDQVLINAHTRLSDFDMMTDRERSLILGEFQGEQVDLHLGKTLHEIFQKQVLEQPNRIALVSGEQNFTYEEINKKANRLARALQEEGLRRGHLVAIMSDRSVDLVIGMLAVLKAGGAYIPLDPAYPDERIQFMLSDSNASMILVQPSLLPRIYFHGKIIELNSTQNVYHDDHNLEIPVNPNDLAFVFYTSGSTGTPKGVMIEHRSVINFLQTLEQRSPLSSSDILLLKTSISFDASVWEIYWWMLKGACLCLLEPGGEKDPASIIRAVEKYKVTHLEFVPSMLQVFMDYACRFGLIPQLASLKYISVGGEVLPASLVKQFYELFNPNHTVLYNTYGPTEATVEVISYRCGKEDGDHTIPIGKPNLNTKIYIFNEHMQLQPIGITGELYIAGECLSRGYVNHDELMVGKFIANPLIPEERLYKTGDLARWLPDGNIEFRGRADRQVKIRGYRIEISEVESALDRIHHIWQSAVIARTNRHTETELYAYFTAAERLSVSEIKAALLQILPEFMVPAHFVQLDSMPMTVNCKIDYKGLPLPEDRSQPSSDFVTRVTPSQRMLANIWQEILDIDQVSLSDHFFELGGHSLKASRLILSIHRDFQVLLTVRDIFDHPIFEDMLNLIEQKENGVFLRIPEATTMPFYPVSTEQKRMSILNQLAPSEVVYNMPAIIKIKGTVDAKRLEHVFQTLVNRHESFRTSFEIVQGELVQIIHPRLIFQMAYEEINESDETAYIQAFIEPFDLAQAPLFRVKLLSMGNSKYILLVDMHHIVSDGVSMNVFMKEWVQLYNGNDLPPLRIHYKDYACWEHTRVKEEIRSRHIDYWLNVFSGELPVLQLPIDFARPKEFVFDGGSVRFVLDKFLTEALKHLANQTNTTINIILLAAYNILLAKYSGQTDIIVGTLDAGRRHADLDSMIGLFIKVLPIRSCPDHDKSFLMFLQEVKTQVLNALEHQNFSFEELISSVNIYRDSSRNALFDTMFIYQNMTESPPKMEQCQIQSFEMIEHVSRYDLTLEAMETSGVIHGIITYATALFKNETIERMANHFVELLRNILQNSEARIGQLSLITKEEQRQIMEEFNGVTVQYSKEKTIHTLFQEQVMLTPDRTAVTCENRSITYFELNARANRLARTLRAHGVNNDQTVGIMVERSIEMIVGILAILKAGGAFVPIDPEYPADRVAFMVKDSACKVLLLHRHLLKRALTNTSNVLFIDDDNSYAEDDSNLNLPMDSRQLAYVIYTSGTTGQPKGVMIEHQQLAAIAASWKVVYRLNEGVFKLLQLASFSFDVFTGDVVRSLLNGGEMVICPENSRKDIDKIANIIQSYGIHLFESTPALVIPLMEHIYNSKMCIPNLKTVIIGSDQCPPEAMNWLIKQFGSTIRIINSYGVTEACIDASYDERSNPSVEHKEVIIGKPYPNVMMYVLNKDRIMQPIGVPGELYIGGEGIGRGYLNQPDLTVERFIDHPSQPGKKLYRTGDLAKWMPDGSLVFLGRTDDQVKIRGYRIEIGEVEHALHKMDFIKNAIVTIHMNQQGEHSLCAYIVSDVKLTIKKLRKNLTEVLPEYMIPSYFIQMDRFPLTPNGKIDRKALPVPINNKSSKTEYFAPSTDVQQLLAELWSTVLQIERVGIYDHFFELGGNSIKAIQVASRLLEAGYKVEIKHFFRHPVIADLCDYVQSVK